MTAKLEGDPQLTAIVEHVKANPGPVFGKRERGKFVMIPRVALDKIAARIKGKLERQLFAVLPLCSGFDPSGLYAPNLAELADHLGVGQRRIRGAMMALHAQGALVWCARSAICFHQDASHWSVSSNPLARHMQDQIASYGRCTPVDAALAYIGTGGGLGTPPPRKREDRSEKREATATAPAPDAGTRASLVVVPPPDPGPDAAPPSAALMVLDALDRSRLALGLSGLDASQRDPADIAARLDEGVPLDKLLSVVAAREAACRSGKSKREFMTPRAMFRSSKIGGSGWSTSLQMLDANGGRPRPYTPSDFGELDTSTGDP